MHHRRAISTLLAPPQTREVPRRQGLRLDPHRQWLRTQKIAPRIARRGVNDPARLGRHRWKIERTIAWLTGYRRLTIRYDRNGDHFRAFLQLAAAITCYKTLPISDPPAGHTRHGLTRS
jgi:transposase